MLKSFLVGILLASSGSVYANDTIPFLSLSPRSLVIDQNDAEELANQLKEIRQRVKLLASMDSYMAADGEILQTLDVVNERAPVEMSVKDKLGFQKFSKFLILYTIVKNELDMAFSIHEKKIFEERIGRLKSLYRKGHLSFAELESILNESLVRFEGKLNKYRRTYEFKIEGDREVLAVVNAQRLWRQTYTKLARWAIFNPSDSFRSDVAKEFNCSDVCCVVGLLAI